MAICLGIVYGNADTAWMYGNVSKAMRVGSSVICSRIARYQSVRNASLSHLQNLSKYEALVYITAKKRDAVKSLFRNDSACHHGS